VQAKAAAHAAPERGGRQQAKAAHPAIARDEFDLSMSDRGLEEGEAGWEEWEEQEELLAGQLPSWAKSQVPPPSSVIHHPSSYILRPSF